MAKKLFIATGQNVLVERVKQNEDTVMGMVISSGDSRFKYGDIVLYKNDDSERIILQEKKAAEVIWSQKIKCVMIEKEDK